MYNDLSPDDYAERFKLARRDARDGYGWNDITVRYGLSSTAAKMLVMEAEFERLSKTQDAKP
jgi:hypothetical protein